MILLYGFEGERLRKLRFILMGQKLAFRSVTPEEYGHPLGYLLGMEGFLPGEAYAGEPLGREMLVMGDLTYQGVETLLAAMKRARFAPVQLKAVVTPENVGWTSLALYQELEGEAAMMRDQSPADFQALSRKRHEKDNQEKP